MRLVRVDIRRADNVDVLLLSYMSLCAPQLHSRVSIDPLVGNVPVRGTVVDVHEMLEERDSLAENGPRVIEVLVEVEE